MTFPATPSQSSNGADPVIRAVGLRKRYPGVEALDLPELAIGKGEVVCVVGPNGAGKTTLLYLLAGLLLPSAGHVTVFGLHRWKDNFAIRKRSAVLPVQPVVGASPTPYELLRFLAQIYHIPKHEFIDRLEHLAAEMQCLGYLNSPWNTLSHGLFKKAGLIGCFLPEVELRILDEPFAGGIDPIGMETLFDWLKASRERGETVVFSTQVLEQAQDIADRIVLLVEGRLAAQGPPRELIERAGVDPAEPRALAKAFKILTRNEKTWDGTNR